MGNVFKSKNYDNYSYPRVRLSTTALRHTRQLPEAEDTTILFAALAADRGPANKIVKLHSVSDLVSVFGNLSYDVNGQNALNIYNWLAAGGTVYAVRLLDAGQSAKSAGQIVVSTPSATEGGQPTTTTTKYNIEAKYFGKYYNDIKVKVSKVGDVYNIKVVYAPASVKSEIILEQYFKVAASAYRQVLKASEYIVTVDAKEASGDNPAIKDLLPLDDGKTELDVSLSGASTDISTLASFETAYKTFLKPVGSGSSASPAPAVAILGNQLETPIDVVLDAGFDAELKKLLFDVFCNESDGKNIRDDVFLFLDKYNISSGSATPSSIPFSLEEKGTTTIDSDEDLTAIESPRLSVHDQYFTVLDSVFTNQDVYVCSSYYIAKLLPYIDNNYGIQWPMSGIRRAVLDDAKDVNKNPSPAEKQKLFDNRINYTERSSREFAFMSQRTHDGSTDEDYTALSFINNSRVLERIKKDLRALGREYLFEFNDATTLANMSAVLNRYLSTWISNRTLTYAEAFVTKNPNSDEAVDVELVVKFNGTIEVITIDITIE